MRGPKRLGREITDAELDRMLAGGHTAITVREFVEALDGRRYQQNTVVRWCERGWLEPAHKMANIWVIYPEALREPLREPRWRFPRRGRPWPQNDEQKEQ